VCAGTVSLTGNDLRCRPEYTPWLASLFVHEDYRKQGIGEALIEQVNDIRKSMGYPELYLRTEDAGGYYRRFGWHHVETCKDDIFGFMTEVYKYAEN
jgi:N-acetylglutamate synthase-like GNAT family acetyltransferase